MITGPNGAFVMVTLTLAILMTMYSIFCVNAQRAHDLGRRATFGGLIYLPYLGILFFLYLSCCKGFEGTNDYGDDPLVQSNGQSTSKIIGTVFMTFLCVLLLLVLQVGGQVAQRLAQHSFPNASTLP